MEIKLILGKLLDRKRHTAHIVLEKGNKYLLLQESTGGIMGLWGLPGGGIDKGETAEMAAEREAEEETGFDVELINKLGELEDKERGSVRHIFSASVRGGELKINRREHMDAKWMTAEEILQIENKLRGAWVLRAIDLSRKN
jgi:8-oxo-dGTP diphosphatase